jgi:hypothetical protein
MPIVRHIKGGAVSFSDAGRRVVVGPGYTGPLPQRIVDKYQKQGRFEIVDEPFPRQTADVKREEALTRAPKPKEPAKETTLGFYIARHRGGGRWHVTETESGSVVSEAMAKDDAIAKSEEMNAARPR